MIFFLFCPILPLLPWIFLENHGFWPGVSPFGKQFSTAERAVLKKKNLPYI